MKYNTGDVVRYENIEGSILTGEIISVLTDESYVINDCIDNTFNSFCVEEEDIISKVDVYEGSIGRDLIASFFGVSSIDYNSNISFEDIFNGYEGKKVRITIEEV